METLEYCLPRLQNNIFLVVHEFCHTKEMINILPGNYMTWTSPLQSCIVCRSILLDVFCFPRCVFFLDLATFWNLYRPLSWSNPFCTWKCFLFFWIRFPLCEHHITIWPNSPAKFPKDTGRKLINSQKKLRPWLPLSYIQLMVDSFFQEEISLWRLENASFFLKKLVNTLQWVLCFKCGIPVFFLYHGNIPSNKCCFLQRLNT